MEKIWLKSYPEWASSEIDMSTYGSLVDVLEQSCNHNNNHPAFGNMGTKITYGELDRYSKAVAAYLLERLHLKKGDRVAIMMPNLLQYPVVLFGILRAGLIVVNVNPLYTAPELTYLLKNSGTKAIIILSNFASVLEESLKEVPVEHVIVTQIGDLFPAFKRWIVNFVVKKIKKMVPSWSIDGAIPFRQMLQDGEKLGFKPVKITQEDIAFLQYTGGTTGVSKGTVLTHGNMVANILQMKEWADDIVKCGEETIITALPLYHIFSLTVNCLVYATLRTYNILITNPRDLTRFIREIKHTKFTAISGVNTLFNAMINHPEFKDIDFSQLHFSMAGGMALQKAVAEKWHTITNCHLIEGYGLTEASPLVTANPLNTTTYTGSIGLPIPSTDISIRDEEDHEVPLNEPGELCIKGPQVMKEYWQSPEETKKAFTEDGWLKTGDIVKMDEKGFIYLVDRKKDIVIVSGFNVYPNEVEEVIAKHPGVLEVAVIGVPDERSGEVVKAFIVKKDQKLTENDIISHCRHSLTRYKVPKKIEFRDTLPKTNVGKILRRALRGN